MEKQKTKTLDMTQGSLWKHIFLFSMPLVLAQLLEVMFNLSDVAVVGQFADYRALGAVGSTTILVTLFTGFLIGMGSGVNVQVALGLGAKDDKTVEKTIHTAFLICAAIGIVIGVFCILFARPMLQALHTKSDLIDAAVLYLKIYALGMPAMAVYNFGNGVLSAKGDTKSPLIYLAVAGVLNIILNLIFVIGFHLAAAGVAIASAIAQYVSMLLVMRNLLKRRDVCRLQISKIQFHQDVAKGVLLMGIPTGMQNAIFAHFHTIPSLYLLYPFSWTLTAIAEIAYFIVQFRKVMPKSRI